MRVDVQLRRGLLEVCVLAAIARHDSYGYQIVREIEPYVEISESTLYPILRRLEAGKMLEVYSVEYGGRLRKYYRITDGGRARLREFEGDWEEIMNIYRFITEGSARNE